jgi:hypothetical protein
MKRRRASDSKKLKMRAVLRGRHLELLKQIGEKAIPRKLSLHLIRGYNLTTSFEEKVIDSHSFADYTVFLNRAGTLAHAVSRGGALLTRIPLYRSLIGASDQYVENVMAAKLDWR